MEIKRDKDGKGNCYIDVGNGRVTYVRGSTREDKKNWAGEDVIRIQAYQDESRTQLHRGEELPVGKDNTTIFEMLGAISGLILNNSEPGI